MPYRQRLIVECFDCQSMPGVAGAYRFLTLLSEAADMRILVPPIVAEVPVPAAADAIATTDTGISGQIIWLESGAQLHTWSEERFLSLDMYSCKSYSQNEVLKLVWESFAPQKMHVLLDDVRSGGPP